MVPAEIEMNTTMGSPAPKWYEPSIYKLYVCPVTGFDKQSLLEEFGQYGEVIDAFVSDPVSNGFQWAFVYFATEEGILEAIRKIEEGDKPYRVNRAKPKIFKPASVLAAEKSVSTKMLNGIGAAVQQANGVSFLTPPNCVFCKRITVKQCISCKNAFCQTECALDGWRFHTSTCIKVAELIKVSEANAGLDLPPMVNVPATGNPIASTVVNFMKDCKSANKKFSTNEFAEACNYRGKGPDMKDEPSIDYVPNIPTPPASKSYHNSNFDKNKRNAASFQKSNMDNSEIDGQPPAPNDKSYNKVPFKKYNKNNDYKDRGNRRSFQNTAPQKPPNHNDHTNGNVESKQQDPWNSDLKRVPFPRKSTPKYNAENEETEQNTYDRPGSKQSYSYQKPDRRNSDPKDTAPVPNGQSNESEKRVAFKPNPPNDQPKRPIRSQEPKITTAPETDLKLKAGDAIRVMVGSIQSENTFYVADSQKVIEVLKDIVSIADNVPELNHAEVNSQCLAFFDGAWYRARIISTNPIQVEYIDYGNREFCDIENLKKMPDALTKYLPLASRVKLHEGSINETNIKENEEVDIYVRQYDDSSDTWIIDAL
ncbi:uncharacterized protein LOC135838983 isoform X2 [Planococcus citri]|uniref:uncharacterized protein LOC135838983 isoform X2 n=1 Tax=Planococcus citri TaxID=170843 RepID=UPI0031F7BC0B